MIYAQFNGVRYGIQFSYDRDVFGYRRNTECSIYNLGNDPNSLPPINADDAIGYGYANLHWEDNFCAETGRKIALIRALEQISEFQKVFNPEFPIKKFRAKIWEAYHLRNNRLSDIRDEFNRTYNVSC